MVGWSVVLLHAALVSSPGDYRQAYQKSLESGRPLVVLVSTDWCPACTSMKNRTIPDLLRRGRLRDVVYTVVDRDKNPRLAAKLMRGSSIPQLIVFSKSGRGWKRQQLTGAQDSGQVSRVISSAVEASHNTAAVSNGKNTRVATDKS